MGRLVSVVSAVLILILLTLAVASCGGGPKGASAPPVPAIITLSPTSASLELGAAQTFSASPRDAKNVPVNTPVTFSSSNTAVLTIAPFGQNSALVCAGTWDSITNPVVCTPGPTGTAQITASASGVISAPVTVYVHQHIDSIVVAPTTTPPSCFSQTQTQNYAATAYSGYNGGTDITATVGTFTWGSLQPTVVKLDSTASGLLPNEVRATARVPGTTHIFASVGTVTSVPMSFTTCPVQSISLVVTGTTDTSFTVKKGSTKALIATVLDSLGATLTGVPLTWSSSSPANAGVSTSGAVSASQPGGSAIIASCTPPTCNIGFTPSLPIYPSASVQATITGTPNATTVYVTSTGCSTTVGCTTSVVPIGTSNNTPGSPFNLPGTPHSFVFNRQGSKAYLAGGSGLMVFDPSANPPTVSTFTTLTGQVLAISPNGNKVIVSDTSLTPNRVFLLDQPTNSSVTLNISGATAADFSPDSLKAYILAGSTLYVYSQVDALQTIPLSAPATDVTFLANGAFAYIAGGSAVTARTTCDNAVAQTVSTPATPPLLKALVDGTHVLAVDSPGFDIITASSAPAGCPPTVSNTVTSVNLGQGSFVPLQLLVSTDGTKAYILTSNFGSVLVYDIVGGSASSIPLAGNVTPIGGGLTSDGTMLYVLASDSLVHRVDTTAGGDVQQISFPTTTTFCTSAGTPVTCQPDLIAVRP